MNVTIERVEDDAIVVISWSDRNGERYKSSFRFYHANDQNRYDLSVGGYDLESDKTIPLSASKPPQAIAPLAEAAEAYREAGAAVRAAQEKERKLSAESQKAIDDCQGAYVKLEKARLALLKLSSGKENP